MVRVRIRVRIRLRARVRATVHLGRILVRACAEGILIGARDAEARGESVGAVPHHLSRELVRVRVRVRVRFRVRVRVRVS